MENRSFMERVSAALDFRPKTTLDATSREGKVEIWRQIEPMITELEKGSLQEKLQSTTMLQQSYPSSFWDAPAPINFTLQLNDTSRETTKEELADLYADLHAKIKQGMEEAKAEGKTFGIILGETHYDSNPLMIERMVTLAAKDLGIDHLLIEKDQQQLDVMKEKLRDGDYNNKRKSNGHYLMQEGLQAHVIAGDPQWGIAETEKTLQTMFHYREHGFERNGKHQDGMLDVLEKMDKPFVAIYGADHIAELAWHMPDNIHALVLDVTNRRIISNAVTTPTDLDKEAHARHEYIMAEANRENGIAEFVVIPGRGVSNTGNAWEMASVAREGFLAQQKENPQAEVAAPVAKKEAENPAVKPQAPKQEQPKPEVKVEKPSVPETPIQEAPAPKSSVAPAVPLVADYLPTSMAEQMEYVQAEAQKLGFNLAAEGVELSEKNAPEKRPGFAERLAARDEGSRQR